MAVRQLGPSPTADILLTIWYTGAAWSHVDGVLNVLMESSSADSGVERPTYPIRWKYQSRNAGARVSSDVLTAPAPPTPLRSPVSDWSVWVVFDRTKIWAGMPVSPLFPGRTDVES